MRFLIVLALFSIPLVYASLGNVGGLAYLINQQRVEERKRQNNKTPADLFRHAEFSAADQVDDDLGLASSASAVPVQDPMDVLNKSAGSVTFTNAQLTASNPLEENMRSFANIEDSSASRDFTGTTNAKNPEEIIEGMRAPGSSAISKAKLTEDGRKLTIFG